MIRFFERIYSWYISIDPGMVRLEKGGLAAFSFLSAWIITREILQTFASQLPAPVYMSVVLFAPILSLLCSIVITDLRPVDRRNSLLLSVLPIAAVLASFVLLPAIPLIYGLILLVLFFLSYYFRRYGIRSMELFLLATITFYFAAILKVNITVLPWFLLATIVAVFSVYLWRFVLLPYNPERLLRWTNATYYREASIIIGEIIQTLQKTPHPRDWMKGLAGDLRRISHCRKVIESQIAALTPPVWTRERLDRIRIDFYNAEQGITLMIQAVSALSAKPEQVPEDLLQTLLKTLAEFQQVLIKVASPQSVVTLDKQYNLLRETINSRIEANPINTWSLPLLRLIAGGSQLNQAVKEARSIESVRKPAVPLAASQAAVGSAVGAVKKQEKKIPQQQISRGFQGINLATLHPTTVLGLQAFLAVLIAMLIGYFLSLDHSNWVFWTAFVVIAGSTGESLRRMSFRVAGTVIGVLAGILIYLMLASLNTGSLPVMGLIAACLFLAAYFVDTSYIWMIFWINIAVTLLFVGLGGTVADILINRPLNTFIGAAIAALIVLFVLPVRTRERFKRALAGFMNTLDQYIAGYTERLMNRPSPNLEAVNVQINTEFAKLEQTFPSLALEYNPLARAQNPLLQLSTTLQALKMDLIHMTQDSASGLIPPLSRDMSNLIMAIKERIHSNAEAIINLLNKKPAGEVRLLTDLFARANQVPLLEKALKPDVEENPESEAYILIYLARVNQALYQTASGIMES